MNTGRNFNAFKTVYVKGKSLGGICWVGVEPGTGLGGQFKLLWKVLYLPIVLLSCYQWHTYKQQKENKILAWKYV